jgi:hypothetical protein
MDFESEARRHRRLNQSIKRHSRRYYRDTRVAGLASEICQIDAEQFAYEPSTLRPFALLSDEAHYQWAALKRQLRRLRRR